MTSKKQGARASARSPIDSVTVDETVKVPEDFISGLKLNLIDFVVDYEAVQAAEAN
jgi:hypothetical protein